jgi:YggT family protein
MTIASLLTAVLEIFLLILFIRVLFSWLTSIPPNPVSRFAYAVTEPVLAPLRRRIPPVSGMDLSPLLVMVLIYFLIAALRSY